MYSGIGIASQSNGCLCLFRLFLFRGRVNRVNRTHPYFVFQQSLSLGGKLPVRNVKTKLAILSILNI